MFENDKYTILYQTRIKEKTKMLKSEIERLIIEKENSEERFKVKRMIVEALERIINQYAHEIEHQSKAQMNHMLELRHKMIHLNKDLDCCKSSTSRVSK